MPTTHTEARVGSSETAKTKHISLTQAIPDVYPAGKEGGDSYNSKHTLTPLSCSLILHFY